MPVRPSNLLIISVALIIVALVVGIVLISWQSAQLQSELTSIRADLATVSARVAEPCKK